MNLRLAVAAIFQGDHDVEGAIPMGVRDGRNGYRPAPWQRDAVLEIAASAEDEQRAVHCRTRREAQGMRR